MLRHLLAARTSGTPALLGFLQDMHSPKPGKTKHSKPGGRVRSHRLQTYKTQTHERMKSPMLALSEMSAHKNATR
jgi:hypothetical protein